MLFIFNMTMTLVIAGIVGYASERFGFTRNGYLPSIMVAMGGAFILFVLSLMFGISFGKPGVNAVIAAIGALLLLPTRFRPISKGSPPRSRRRTRR